MDHQISLFQPKLDHMSESLFLNEQGPEIDNVFGGLTVREDGTLKIPDHYKKLQPMLEAYIRQDDRYDLGTNPTKRTKREWEALFDDVASAEAKASESDGGPFDIFDRMMVKVGQRADQIDPWINLIPDELGLCVVKSAFAILLERARSYSDKRQAIFDGFLSVRDIIGEASSKGIHFQAEPSVYRQAGDLYEVIVDAIHELLAMAKPQKRHKWLSKTRKDDQTWDPQTVLKGVNDSAKALSLAVDNCRDAIIKDTGKDAKLILGEVQFIGWKAAEIRHTVSKVHSGQQAQLHMLMRVQQTQQALLELAQARDDANSKLLDSFRQQQKKYELTITKLEKLVREEHAGSEGITPVSNQALSSRAVISLGRLMRILSASSPDMILDESTPIDLGIFQLRQSEFRVVLKEATRFNPRSQSQAHSILNQDRFFDWMHQTHPDILLVDGNAIEFSRANITPFSLFCVNLGLTMSKREPDSVFVHFYCGLHSNPREDGWYGPKGMLRSLSLQLLVALVERESLDLSFLNRRTYVRGLEHHDLNILCDLFHEIVQQFGAETTIYCTIDNISKFDVDFNNTFKILKESIRRLQEVVRDDELRPRLKILMTVPFRSSARLRQSLFDDSYISLSSLVSGSHGVSESSVAFSFSDSATPLKGSYGSKSQQERTMLGEEDYDDE